MPILRFDEITEGRYSTRVTPTLARRIQRAYPQVYLACHVRHTTSAADHGLSARDASVLAHLDAHEDDRSAVTAGELARHLGVGASTISEAIDHLEELGLARRRRATSDRRRVELRITPAGVKRMQQSSVLDTRRLSALLERLPVTSRETAVRGLELLAEAARALTESEARPTTRRQRIPR